MLLYYRNNMLIKKSITENKVPVDNNLSVLYGRVQSGKRDHIMQYAIDCVNADRNCVIVTNNITSDLLLLKESFENILDTVEKRIIHVISNNKTCEQLAKTMRNKRCILLTLFNKSKLKKVYKLAKVVAKTAKNSKNNKIIFTNFIFDEGDLSMNTENSARNELVEKIISKFNSVFVSATPKSLFFENKNLLCSNVYEIPITENYVPLEQVVISKIENNKEADYLETLFDKCSVHEFVGKAGKMYKVKGIFFNIDRKVFEHTLLMNILKENYPDSYIVVNDDASIKVYKSKKLIALSKKSLPSTLYDIQKKWTNGTDNTSDYRYLFLIGSNKISRCTPIRAELPQKPTNCNEMLLITNMFYLPSIAITESNMVQQIRLVGVYPKESRPVLNLFTTEKVSKAILKYNKAIDEVLTNYKSETKTNNTSTTAISTKPVSKADYVKCYNVHKKIQEEGLIYLTKDSYSIKKTGTVSKEYDFVFTSRHSDTFNTIIKCIIEANKSLTSREIFEKAFINSTGGLTPFNTISARCSDLFNKFVLIREGSVPYKYSLSSSFGSFYSERKKE